MSFITRTLMLEVEIAEVSKEFADQAETDIVAAARGVTSAATVTIVSTSDEDEVSNDI